MHDVIIIGGGFAGLSAAIYTVRFNLETLVVAKNMGGVITESYLVENYPGFKSISGIELMDKFIEQAKYLGAELKETEVKKIKKEGRKFVVETSDGKFESKAILLAMGSVKRDLNVPGIQEFRGKGVSYCATCDAAFFKDKIAGVVGGGNSAAEAAILLAKHAKKVYLLYRGDDLHRVEPVMVNQIKKEKKIEVVFNVNVKKVKGDKVMGSVVLDNGKELKVDGLFIEIGADPASGMAKQLGVKLDAKGHIITDAAQRTNIPMVYAAGDITTGSNMFEQGVCAASEGAIAADSIFKDLRK